MFRELSTNFFHFRGIMFKVIFLTLLPFLQVLNRPVTTLRTVEKVSRIVEILKSCTYNGFPVVDSIPTEEEARSFKSYGTLRGLILRSQLTVLLKHKVSNKLGRGVSSELGENKCNKIMN